MLNCHVCDTQCFEIFLKNILKKVLEKFGSGGENALSLHPLSRSNGVSKKERVEFFENIGSESKEDER